MTVTEGPVRRQRVRVPMRLVSSAAPDVALSVYVKVKALGARPEGCQARAETIASYLGLSKPSVERGLKALSRPASDGVIELRSQRRTMRGGRGTSAVRSVRPMKQAEAFVWLPVAAAEDLTPRQLRAYAVIAYAEQMRMALTEAELAGHLLHHSGKRAGQPITATAAGEVVDGLEAARWVTVQRRAGAQGRHRFIAHDIAPTAAEEVVEQPVADASQAAKECRQEPVGDPAQGPGSPLVGEGSGSLVGEGSLANRESPRTDSPDDERAFCSSAVGDLPVVEGAGPRKSSADAVVRMTTSGGFALRAEGRRHPSPQPDTSPLGWALGYQVPQVADILARIVPSASGYQRDRLERLVGGLLVDGEDDAMIAARLRERLKPLATGDPERPYAFRRDGLSWVLRIGLPYTPGGMTSLPCARRGCRGLVRAKATDRVRCDACELAVLQWQEAVQARRALEAALAARPPQVEAEHAPLAADAPTPKPPLCPQASAVRSARQSAKTALQLPASVREQLGVLAVVAPEAVRVAEKAACAAYTPATEAETDAQHARRVSAATATWCAVLSRYADQLAAHVAKDHAGSAA
ncbi:hypothetical protein OG436_39365 (plasmid) [Streptomyces caniferus]|uniref:hypothetical protein n=1 Tax=Streptomyces caniferus TaxID=285557 RepID=UPI002E288883|nr:hypothetical protein [Streptomyces caniferus]